MSRVLPILFNTEMVRAILYGRKTVTRRPVKYKYSNTEMKMRKDKYGERLIEIQKDVEGETYGKNPDGSTWRKLLPYIEKEPPYKKGDILYVRETFCPNYFNESIAGYRNDGLRGNRNAYKADYNKAVVGDVVPEPKWKPSIHMPKEAARIWLKVTDVRAEQIKDMILDDFLCEGITLLSEAYNDPENAYQQAKGAFLKLIKRIYPDCTEDSWFWLIEFERCEKPESEA